MIYPLLLARFGGKTVLNDAEFFTGSYVQLREHPLFPEFLARQKRRFLRMRGGMLHAEKQADPARLALLETILSQIKEMEQA